MAGTAISDIMEATSLAKGGIYRNFESKDEICLEVFNYLSGKLSSRINEVISEQEGQKDKLFALLDFYLNTLARKDTIDLGGCPLLNFGTEADDTNPLIKQRVAAAIKSQQNTISRVITNGMAIGEFANTVNADEFAIKMFSMLEGGILSSRILDNNYQMQVITDMLKTEIKAFSK